jgi:hypothetical protein
VAREQREAGRLAEGALIIWDSHDTPAQELAGNRILLQAAERDWGASGRDEAQDVVLVTPGRHDLARAMIADLGGERANKTDHTAVAEAMATMRPRSASFIPGKKALARDAFEKYTSSMCSDATTRPP